ncbi:hypothetical protein [Burkholderia ambifaria]|uniref:hypothetical protein n=1 Tax=Burkholderia ambifaria TaxID=152480 RepID=UPI0015899BBB|nr:hypothetical protein [Burkholderia ambifaria]
MPVHRFGFRSFYARALAGVRPWDRSLTSSDHYAHREREHRSAADQILERADHPERCADGLPDRKFQCLGQAYRPDFQKNIDTSSSFDT